VRRAADDVGVGRLRVQVGFFGLCAVGWLIAAAVAISERRHTDSLVALLLALFFCAPAFGAFRDLRRMPPWPPEPPPLRADASPLVRALRALQLLKLQVDLPARLDRHRLAAEVDELRRHVAAIPGPNAEARHAADRLAREVRDGRAAELSEQLDELRLTLIHRESPGS
jgi:hypothetical protein